MAEHWQQIQLERELLAKTRKMSLASRNTFAVARANSDAAVAKSVELDQRLSDLIDRVTGRPASETCRRQPLLRILSQLDQAEAATCQILATDVGHDVDELAVSLGRLVEEMARDVQQLIEVQRTGSK
jgi:hypothetical protein